MAKGRKTKSKPKPRLGAAGKHGKAGKRVRLSGSILDPVLPNILSFLTFREQARVATVSKSWAVASRDPRLLPRQLALPAFLEGKRYTSQGDWLETPALLPNMLLRVSPFLTELTLERSFPSNLLSLFVLAPLPNLQLFDVNRVPIQLLRKVQNLLFQPIWPALKFLWIGALLRTSASPHLTGPVALSSRAWYEEEVRRSTGTRLGLVLDSRICTECNKITQGRLKSGAWPSCPGCKKEWCDSGDCAGPDRPFWDCPHCFQTQHCLPKDALCTDELHAYRVDQWRQRVGTSYDGVPLRRYDDQYHCGCAMPRAKSCSECKVWTCNLCELDSPFLSCSFCTKSICNRCIKRPADQALDRYWAGERCKVFDENLDALLPQDLVRRSEDEAVAELKPVIDHRTCHTCQRVACHECARQDPRLQVVICYICRPRAAQCLDCLDAKTVDGKLCRSDGEPLKCDNHGVCSAGVCEREDHKLRRQVARRLCRRCDWDAQQRFPVDGANDTDDIPSDFTADEGEEDQSFDEMYDDDSYYGDHYGGYNSDVLLSYGF